MHKLPLAEIESIVGKDNLLTSPEERMCYSFDATNQKFLPDAVAFPRSAEHVSAIMRCANLHRFPVIPRGAGSGFAGGSLAVEGGLMLALTRMNRIVSIMPENLTAIVEPGVVTGDFQKAVEQEGLFYPPDPASLQFSTMGGNAATCSGGPRCVKYGVTKNYILGLEVVLPTGELLKTGVQTLKGVAGYDLTSLFVGSEGTLGIITRINVRLIPLPQARQCMLATFPRLDDAPLTVSAIIKSHIIPSTLEFIDQTAIRFMDDYLRIGLPFTEAEALLLIEVDGDKELISKQCTAIEKICYGQGASAVQIARSPEEEAQIWRQRRSLSPNLLKLNPDKINEDITVPISKIPDIIRRVGAIAEKYRLISVCFGHAGDGNIHVNLMINRKNPDDVANAHKAVKEIFRATLELGGTISGEHGIGITKAPFLEMDIGSENFALMNRLKHLLDPHHILNPGKLALS